MAIEGGVATESIWSLWRDVPLGTQHALMRSIATLRKAVSESADLELASEPKSVALARAAVRDYASELGADLVADAELLVSELVSNALVHGGEPIRLRMSLEHRGLFVSVHDDGDRLPKMSAVESGPTDTSGRGLRTVQVLASSWGVAVEPDQPGKSVWFRLAAAHGEPGNRDQATVVPPHPSWMVNRWPRAVSMDEMLNDVRDRLDSDTATVLLLDRSRLSLEPVLAVGLDRTVRRAVRVPLGVGFAGRIAQTRQPVIIPEVDSSNVINPVLLDRHVRSLLGVPIVLEGELLGVLHVGTFSRRDFRPDDVARLEEIARDVARILKQQFSDDEHVAALTLQRSLLPSLPSVHSGMEIAARYVPAEGDLGGDWYDVFDLPGGRMGLAMGDVVGHGLEAAVVMGRLRSALRAYALEHDDPAEVLMRLDRKICHFEPDALATVIFGIASEPFSDWRFSSAGHLAPLVAAPDGTPIDISAPIDPLLGINPLAQRRTFSVNLDEGGLVCVFTDGLVERRPAPDEQDRDTLTRNVQRLREVLQRTQDPESVCVRVLSDVVGDEVTEDDLAILVARRAGAASLAARGKEETVMRRVQW